MGWLPAGRARRDERGVVQVEYLEVLILVTLGMMLATLPLGVMLLRYYDVIDGMIGLPFP